MKKTGRKHTGQAKLLSGKERSNALHRELRKVSLGNLLVGKFLRSAFLWVSTDFVEDFHGEPGLGLVLVGDALNGRDGLLLTATRQQELRRLVQMEQEETADKHDEGDGTKGQDQVSPAHVVLLAAALLACTDLVAGR